MPETSLTARFLRRALARAERSIHLTRLVVIALMTVEEVLFLARRPELARSFVGWAPMLVMAAGAAVTLLGLRRTRDVDGPPSPVTTALDALLILGVSLPPALHPLPDYAGAFDQPTFPFFLVAIAASALRLSRRVVRLSIACNAAAGLLLLAVDALVGHAPPPSIEDVVVWTVAFVAAGFVADATALRSRRLVFEGASLAAQEERARAALGAYVSEEVAAASAQPGALAPAGRRQAVAIVVADLVGFGAYAADVSPEQLVRELNAYLGEMVGVVRRTGGTVERFQGSAMVILFGVPVPTADAASRALRATAALREAARAHQEARVAAGRPAFPVAIGAHFGEVVIGSIGAPDRLQYSAVGDAVNLALQLQRAAARDRKEVYVSGALAVVGGRVEGLPALLEGPPVALSGRTTATPVYALAAG